MASGDRFAVYEAMAGCLAQLHSVDPAAVGVADFGSPGDYFMRQISRWSRQYQSVGWGRVEAIDRLIEWLPRNMPVPPPAVAVVHGDFRLDNLIFDAAAPDILAILDWELSTLGHPLGDLSYQCMQWRLGPDFFGGLGGVDRTSLGLPSEADYVAIYCDRMGWAPIADWDHYIVYNYFKFACIVHGVAHRASTGAASNPRAAEFAALIEPTAQLGWRLAQQIG
jgi:aminoglycoside phosphotransferase (APT) family kinase protein